jgi:alkylation response protein AidB-like acyl-CoA dehydrogenase
MTLEALFLSALHVELSEAKSSGFPATLAARNALLPTGKQWLLCGELGLLGLSVPRGYGGCGYDALTTSRAIEAFGRGCEDMGLVFSVSVTSRDGCVAGQRDNLPRG